jgi:hypothetical protein
MTSRSTIYTEADLPENARLLRGFIWRGDEQIRTKEDIFPKEELEIDEKIQKESKAEALKPETPMEPSKETLEYDKPTPVKKTVVKKKK